VFLNLLEHANAKNTFLNKKRKKRSYFNILLNRKQFKKQPSYILKHPLNIQGSLTLDIFVTGRPTGGFKH